MTNQDKPLSCPSCGSTRFWQEILAIEEVELREKSGVEVRGDKDKLTIRASRGLMCNGCKSRFVIEWNKKTRRYSLSEIKRGGGILKWLFR